MIRLLIFLICIFVTTVAFAEALNIEIMGLSGEIEKNAMERLLIQKQGLGNELNNEKIDEFFEDAENNLRKSIEPFGYFKPKIKSRLSHADSTWTAYFDVALGSPIYITQVNVKLTGPGKHDPALIKAIRDFPIRPGQPFHSPEYVKARDNLFEIANDEGYIKASLEKREVRVDLQTYTVQIILSLNTGPRQYFGDISFQQSGFSEEFLRRFLSFRESEPFSSKTLLKFQENLSASGYFKEVTVKPQFKQTYNNFVPVLVEVEPRKSQEYNIGLGYGTFTGPRVSAGVDFRHLTNTGHHMSAQLKYSSVLKGLAATYFIPGKNPLTDEYTLGVNAQEFLPKNATSFSKTFSAGYVSHVEPWQYSIEFNYLNEGYKNFIINTPGRHSGMLYPALNLIRLEADNILYPTHGSLINLTVKAAAKPLLSTTNYIQGDAKGKFIFSPTTYSRVILSGELGYTSVQKIKYLPITLQFFAGGMNSIRGYGFTFFGPGRYLEIGSIELQHTIYGNLSGAIFYDKGTASNHFGGPFSAGDGIGLIYRSVIGPIKLYLARAESKPGKPKSVEFTLGSDF